MQLIEFLNSESFILIQNFESRSNFITVTIIFMLYVHISLVWQDLQFWKKNKFMRLCQQSIGIHFSFFVALMGSFFYCLFPFIRLVYEIPYLECFLFLSFKGILKKYDIYILLTLPNNKIRIQMFRPNVKCFVMKNDKIMKK